MAGTTVNQGIRTTISVFYIQDENGLIYKFDQLELTKVLETKYCDATLTQAQTQPNCTGGNVYHDGAFDNNNLVNPYVVNTWYLSQIKDPLTQRTINISYQIRNINADAGASITHYGEKNYSVISHNSTKTQTPIISSIDYPDGHQVYFNYGDARVDLSGDLALSSIDIKYQGRFLSEYQLTAAYFILNRIGMPANAFQKSVARLCLRSVKKIGVDLKDEESPYRFEYFTGSNNLSSEPNENTLQLLEDIVPPPFFHIKDIWGYYNGNNSIAYDGVTPIAIHKPLSQLGLNDLMGLCFIRNGSSSVALNAKPGYAKNGLLKKIIYPTGGTLSYQYDQNVGKINGQTINVGGVHVSTTSVTDGGTVGNANDCNNPIVTNYSYLDNSNQSSLWGLETPVNSDVVYSHYKPEYKKWKWLSPGCKWVYKYPGILSREQAVTLTGNQQFLVAFSKAMEVFSAIMNVVDIINICISATPAAIIAIVLDVIAIVVGIIISCSDNTSQELTSSTFFNSDRNNNNPLPVQFSQVTVTESSGSNGKTVMEFTSPADYPLWESANPKFSMKQRYAHYAYGLPLKTTVKDGNGNIVKETVNKYTFGAADRYNVHPSTFNPPVEKYTSCKCGVIKSNSQRNTDWEIPPALPFQTQSGIDMNVEMYQNHIGHVQLYETSEKIYKPASTTDYLETNTSIGYNTNYLPNLLMTGKSNGDLERKEMYYILNCFYNSEFKIQ